MRTKAWENIQKKNKGMREFSIFRVGHGKTSDSSDPSGFLVEHAI